MVIVSMSIHGFLNFLLISHFDQPLDLGGGDSQACKLNTFPKMVSQGSYTKLTSPWVGTVTFELRPTLPSPAHPKTHWPKVRAWPPPSKSPAQLEVTPLLWCSGSRLVGWLAHWKQGSPFPSLSLSLPLFSHTWSTLCSTVLVVFRTV